MQETSDLDWRSEFTSADYRLLGQVIPQAIHACQDRSARAHTEYSDPDDHQYLYGNGMARGVQKDLQPLIAGLGSYREETVPGTQRKLLFVGRSLLLPLRVGKKMPKNHLRIRLNYLPDARRELLTSTSNKKYLGPSLFELPPKEDPVDDVAQISDVLRILDQFDGPVTLFPAYYSSTPLTVGQMYWGPARLNGHYLEFTDPDRLNYRKVPSSAETAQTKPRATGGFGTSERPRTHTRLRKPDPGQAGRS